MRKSHPNSGQKQNIRIDNISFKNVAKFKYLGMTLTNENDIHDGIKSRLNSRNACYHSVQTLMSSHLISKEPKDSKLQNCNLTSCAVWVQNLVSLLGRSID
jgi:hypothetical protein